MLLSLVHNRFIFFEPLTRKGKRIIQMRKYAIGFSVMYGSVFASSFYICTLW